MNILIIPSWYPTDKNPINGIFTKEQAMAIAEENKNIVNVIVAKRDNGYLEISLRKPYKIPISVFKYLTSKIEDRQVTDNFYEFFTPTLTWSKRLPFDGVNRIYVSIRKTVERVLDKFGKIDIIHAQVSYPAGFIAYKISKEFNIPYVLTEHMSPFPFKFLLKANKPIDEIITAFQNAKRTIAVSSFLRNRIRSFGLSCTDVVPNLVDEARFYPSEKKNKKFTFLTVCFMTDQKGIDILLYAISKLDKSFISKTQFIIGGDGLKLDEYKNLAKKLGLSNVYFIGRVNRNEAPRIFSSSHVYVMPSRHETFGVVYAEAIASGLPVIATRCGGPEDIVNESNGILIDVDDIDGLGNAISYMFENYYKYDPNKIREDFEKRFSKKAVVSQLMKIYNEVLQNVRNSRDY
jgi:glycosyltransferase involved in cell wall biosynthesis